MFLSGRDRIKDEAIKMARRETENYLEGLDGGVENLTEKGTVYYDENTGKYYVKVE